jgi:hypothetical protein
MNSSPAPGHGPSGPWPQTVRASAEDTIADCHRSDWRSNRRQQLLTSLFFGRASEAVLGGSHLLEGRGGGKILACSCRDATIATQL